MSYHKCDDCGERFDRTEVVFDDNAGLVFCTGCDAEVSGEVDDQLYAQVRARSVVFA